MRRDLRPLVRLLAALAIAVPGAAAAGARRAPASSTPPDPAYEDVLRRRHFDMTCEQLAAVGHAEYARWDQDLSSQARRIDSRRTWREIVHDFERTHHPAALADVVPAYRREIARARAFVATKGLVTIPATATELTVREAPPQIAGSVAYGIYFWNDDVLMVSLGQSGIGEEDDQEVLTSQNDGLIAVAAVHEAYPGHRVQNLLKRNPPTTADTETFTEGWGLYSEELMLTAGYYDEGPPEQKLFAERMLLYRGARAFLDAELHCGTRSVADTIRFLSTQVGLSDSRARVEVMDRYLKSPGSAATYLVGKRQIQQLRDEVKQKEGAAFSLRSFHDRLLSPGAAPVQDLARRVFGVELDVTGVRRVGAEAPK
jgi:uncharacterized protein (DUF885 family)